MVPKRIKYWIAGLIGLAIIIIILLAIFSFFILLLPVVIVLFIIGLLFKMLRKSRSEAIFINTISPEASNKETIDVEYTIKDK